MGLRLLCCDVAGYNPALLIYDIPRRFPFRNIRFFIKKLTGAAAGEKKAAFASEEVYQQHEDQRQNEHLSRGGEHQAVGAADILRLDGPQIVADVGLLV